LTLGWRVTNDFQPKYWQDKDAKPGQQAITDIVRIPSQLIRSHTVIIAKSGSGKSFFLGRLIEEIILKTKSRCLILDSNADFRRVHEIQDADMWTSAGYNHEERTGILPTEPSIDDFKPLWTQVSTRIFRGDAVTGPPYEPFKLWWPMVSAEFLAEDLDSINSSQLRQCHTVVRSIATLFRLRSSARRRFGLKKQGTGTTDFGKIVEYTENFLSRRQDEGIMVQTLNKDFKEPTNEFLKRRSKAIDEVRRNLDVPELGKQIDIDRVIQQAVRASKYVSDPIIRFYFMKVKQYLSSGILADEYVLYSDTTRLRVVDLPSLGNYERILAVSATLEAEQLIAYERWAKVMEGSFPLVEDERVPIFIIIDEAHNFLPAETNDRAKIRLREQFRTIAAEGRKYGLFLVLASQRPDRLDPYVMSECDNKAVMELDSVEATKSTAIALGVENKGLLSKCTSIGKGRVMVMGRWSREPQILYCAARRTLEGGGNLRDKFWARPYPEMSRDERY
jgi:hypothetical protein